MTSYQFENVRKKRNEVINHEYHLRTNSSQSIRSSSANCIFCHVILIFPCNDAKLVSVYVHVDSNGEAK
jgi:hypothetical protein